MNEQKSRPVATNNGAAKNSTTTGKFGSIITADGRIDWQRLHLLVASSNGMRADRIAYVAIVETSAGKYRRRVFLSLEAANKAVQRAHDRGVHAVVSLHEMRPVAVDQ